MEVAYIVGYVYLVPKMLAVTFRDQNLKKICI